MSECRILLGVGLLVIAAGWGLSSAWAKAKPQSGRSSVTQDRLVGAWSLLRMETIRPDGSGIAHELVGKHPAGLLIYTPDGHMAAQIMRRDRPTVQDQRRAKVALSAEDANALLNGYLAYFGTYRIDEEQGVITHHLEATLHSGSVGRTFVRHYHLDGDQLVLTTPTVSEAGDERYDRVTFRRTSTLIEREGG